MGNGHGDTEDRDRDVSRRTRGHEEWAWGHGWECVGPQRTQGHGGEGMGRWQRMGTQRGGLGDTEDRHRDVSRRTWGTGLGTQPGGFRDMEGTGTWWDPRGDAAGGHGHMQRWTQGHGREGVGTWVAMRTHWEWQGDTAGRVQGHRGWAWGHGGEDAEDTASPRAHLHSIGELHLVDEEGDKVPSGDCPRGHQLCPIAEEP